MHCSEFRSHLNRLEVGELSPVETRRWEDHLLTCPDCLDFYLQKVPDIETGFASHAEDLTKSILAATTGENCEVSEERLTAALADGADATADTALQSHLHDCPNCRRFAMVMSSLDVRLLELRELSPPPGFCNGVLQRTTSRSTRGQVSLVNRLQSLVRRPRFSMEAALLCTVLWAVAIGLPAGLFSTASADTLALQRSLDTVQAGMDQQWQQLTPAMREGVEGLDQLLDQAARTSRQMIDRSTDSYRRLAGRINGWLDTAISGFGRAEEERSTGDTQ